MILDFSKVLPMGSAKIEGWRINELGIYKIVLATLWTYQIATDKECEETCDKSNRNIRIFIATRAARDWYENWGN